MSQVTPIYGFVKPELQDSVNQTIQDLHHNFNLADLVLSETTLYAWWGV